MKIKSAFNFIWCVTYFPQVTPLSIYNHHLPPQAFPHTTLADARILTRTLPNAPQNYVFITRNREVSESQEAEFTIYGLEELILAVETVC